MLTSGVFGYPGDYALWVALYLSLLVHVWCFFRIFPRDRHRRLGLNLGNGLVLASMLGGAALVGETYYRFIAIETDAFGMSLPARRWFALYTELNSLGHRDKEWSLGKPDGLRRIAFVGDSFTYGWGIERIEDRFPDRIQAMFDRRSPGVVEIMNVAKPGWGTGDQIKPIEELIARYGVDEVVLCYVPNDIEKLLPRTTDFDPIRPPTPSLVNLSSSCLVDQLYRRVWIPRVPTVRRYHDWLATGFADPEIWRRHQQQLGAILDLCRDHDVTIRVALLPFLRTNGEGFRSSQLHATLRGFFEANGAAVVDLLPVVTEVDASRLVVSSHDSHPNERAHERFAESIWQRFYATPAP